MTASRFFDAVSKNYGTVKDYQARIRILHDETVMEGMIYYKTPNLLRINFTQPEGQVLVVDGIQLMMYLPLHHVLMRQEITRHSQASLATMVNEQGLKLLEQNYSVAFLDGPDPVPLEEGSDEMVRKLNLAWRTPGQGFRQIKMSVNKDMLIRRMVGISDNYETFQFDFFNIQLNQDLPNARFIFEEPPEAYMIENFLFEPEN
jgi:outer membrane lipoprotein-sorting protein